MAPEAVLPENEVLGAEADHAGGAVARRLERPELRKHGRDAEAAPDQHHVPGLADVLREAERADEVREGVAALVVISHLERRLAERLDDERDRALVPVVVGDRERDALAAFMQAQHDEVPGRGGLRHVGRLDLPQEGRVGEGFPANDGVHESALGPF